MRTATVLVLVAACGGGTKPAITNTASSPSTAARVACPTGAELEQLARSTWNATGGTATAHCTAFVRAGDPLWLVEGRIDRDGPDGRTVDFHSAVLGARDHRVIRIEVDPQHPWTANGVEYEVADLDADGTDELIEVQTIRDDVHVEQTLTINHVAPDDPDHPTLPLDGSRFIPLTNDTCASTHRVIPGPDGTQQLEVVGTGAGDTATCPQPGRHVYAWNGTDLVEAAP